MQNYDEHLSDGYNEFYYLNGVLHRIDGPAYIKYDTNGKIEYEAYYITC
jgi:hypothetical protein